METQEIAQVARPERCPNGHEIWWAWSNIYGDYGICSGNACKHVWRAEKGKAVPCPAFNHASLVRMLRRLAIVQGVWDMDSVPKSTAHDAMAHLKQH